MSKRTRLLALIAAAAVLLPAAAQAHWNSWCGCWGAHYRYHYSHYRGWYYVPRERSSLAVELAPNVFAVPYRLRHYPYVSGGYDNDGLVAPAIAGSARGQSRVIDADAQVTILGPDRMDIRLFRKGRGVVIHSDP